MNITFVESSRSREAHGFKGRLQRAVAVAFLGGVVLAASSVLLHEGDGYQTFPEVDSVLHSAMPGIPDDAGRTMVDTYCG